MSPHHIEQVIQALHSSRDGKRRKAAEELRQHGEPGGLILAEAFIQLLRQDRRNANHSCPMMYIDTDPRDEVHYAT